MADIKDLSDALTDEVMNEVADKFFGTRKAIDDVVEYFEEKAELLEQKLERVYHRSAYLRCMSLNDANYREFWISLGIDPEPFRVPDGYPCEMLHEKRPFAFTARGEFTKCYRRSYERLREAVEDYVHGHYVNDPENKGKKILTVNRTDLFQLCEAINAKVRKVNAEVSPSGVLQFTKTLDPQNLEKEKIGACAAGKCDQFDNDMKFKEIDFNSYGLRDIPILPPEKEVSASIIEFCEELYSENREAVKEMVKTYGCR